MTRFDSAEDAERTIAYFIADTLQAVRRETPNAMVAPQDIQAAYAFTRIVCRCPDAYRNSERLHRLAVDLASSIDHDAEGSPLAGTSRAWVAGVELRRST